MSFKMKSKLLAGILAFALSGAARAQVAQGTNPFRWDFDAASRVSSVESRYAFGFGSLVDDYISPVWYGTYDFGTFAFLGGGISAGDLGTGVSLGFGKALKNSYLGVYYGGSLASGGGQKEDNSPLWKPGNTDKVADTAASNSDWDSRLAVLYGMGSMGFRLDLILADSSARETQDGGLKSRTSGGNSSMAATFGTYNGSNMGFSAQVGFKFPAQTVQTNYWNDASKKPDKRRTHSSGATLGINGSLDYELDDAAAVEAEAAFASIFPTSHSGDKWNDGDSFKPYTEGGAWGVNLDAVYRRTFVFGNDAIGHTTLKARPGLNLGFASTSSKSTQDGLSDEEKNPPSLANFTFGGKFELGAEYKYQKIAIYTGIDFGLFTVRTAGFTGGHDRVKSSAFAWEFEGINWASTDLAFGLAFTPIEEGTKKLTFAAGVDVNVFDFNPQTMDLEVPDINVNDTSSAVSTSSLFSLGPRFSLTVSYSF